ncbi:MAG: hypothetical protein KDI13_10765 [Alphaproteobacteria bacterium]|nr:hypothetical protein [Alphaproteobacteria bacterium]
MQKDAAKTLALAKNRLQLPLVVRDILKGNASMDDAARYAMHTLLSDLQAPDMLLCAALALKEIADHQGMEFSGYNFLHTECNRMTKRYAHANIFIDVKNISDTKFANVLDDLAGDLESFAEILELCKMSFEILHPESAEIINIFCAQIQSQILITDELIRIHGEATQTIPSLPQTGSAQEDNVITFRLNA